MKMVSCEHRRRMFFSIYPPSTNFHLKRYATEHPASIHDIQKFSKFADNSKFELRMLEKIDRLKAGHRISQSRHAGYRENSSEI